MQAVVQDIELEKLREVIPQLVDREPVLVFDLYERVEGSTPYHHLQFLMPYPLGASATTAGK